MKSVVVKAKKWGNSLGIILPKEIVRNAGIREGSYVEALIATSQKNVLKDLFGSLKGKEKIRISTARLMKRIDRELYNE